MAKVLKMVFKLSDTQTATVSLADPKAGLTKADAETVMNEMIAKNALVVKGVNPKAIKSTFVRARIRSLPEGEEGAKRRRFAPSLSSLRLSGVTSRTFIEIFSRRRKICYNTIGSNFKGEAFRALGCGGRFVGRRFYWQESARSS